MQQSRPKGAVSELVACRLFNSWFISIFHWPSIVHAELIATTLEDHYLIDQTSRDGKGAECNPPLPDIGDPGPDIKRSATVVIIGERCDVVHRGLT